MVPLILGHENSDHIIPYLNIAVDFLCVCLCYKGQTLNNYD